MNLTNQQSPIISAVIPAYNESQGLKDAITKIAEILDACEKNWEIVIVDDGSSDQTYQQVVQLAKADSRIKGIALSRNFGKEAAMLAGLEHAKGEAEAHGQPRIDVTDRRALLDEQGVAGEAGKREQHPQRAATDVDAGRGMRSR